MRVFTPVSAIIWKKEGGPPIPPRSIVNVLAATAMGADLIDDPTEQETEFTLAKVPQPGNINKVIVTPISTAIPYTGSITIEIPAGRTYALTLLALMQILFTEYVSGVQTRMLVMGHWRVTEGGGTVTFGVEMTIVQVGASTSEARYTLRRNGVDTGQMRGEFIHGVGIIPVAGHLIALMEDIT